MLTFTRRLSLALSSSSSSLMMSTTQTPTTTPFPWRHISVEWSPTVAAKILSSDEPSLQASVTHWVFPDLPQLEAYRQTFLDSTGRHCHATSSTRNDGTNQPPQLKPQQPPQQMITLSVSRHATWQSLVETAKSRLYDDKDSNNNNKTERKLLIVGGNEKTSHSPLSTENALTILRNELEWSATESLWAVTDPNDPRSVDRVQSKLVAGAHGFVTQPLFTSTAWEETLPLYQDAAAVPFVIGMALPRTLQNLMFWQTLLEERPDVLQHNDDPCFSNHVAYFSSQQQTNNANASLAWMEQELQRLERFFITTSATSPAGGGVQGVHFMPLKNVNDLVAILQSRTTINPHY